MNAICRAAVAPLVFVLASGMAAKPRFVSTWKAPEAQGLVYAGKTIVSLVVVEDMQLRISAEEALAQDLTARGMKGVAAYRLIPREEIRDPDRVKAWFERAGASGVVIMRLVDVARETAPSAVVWQSGSYYNSLWSYYPYVWGANFDITPARNDVKIVVETLLFDIGGSRLLWAGTSETTNPEGAQELVKNIVDAAADQMKKDGLIQK
jgi:hypothetical protein